MTFCADISFLVPNLLSFPLLLSQQIELNQSDFSEIGFFNKLFDIFAQISPNHRFSQILPQNPLVVIIACSKNPSQCQFGLGYTDIAWIYDSAATILLSEKLSYGCSNVSKKPETSTNSPGTTSKSRSDNKITVITYHKRPTILISSGTYYSTLADFVRWTLFPHPEFYHWEQVQSMDKIIPSAVQPYKQFRMM